MTSVDLIRSYLGTLYGCSPATIQVHTEILLTAKRSFLTYSTLNGFDIINTTINDIET